MGETQSEQKLRVWGSGGSGESITGESIIINKLEKGHAHLGDAQSEQILSFGSSGDSGESISITKRWNGHGVENLWSWSLSFGFYQSWL